MSSQYTYIICNAATDIGKKVADVLLAQNCHIILAGPTYAALSTMEKELNENGEHSIEVALLEPSKEIDWQNLSDSLDDKLAGVIHIHELDVDNSLFFDTSYAQFSTIIDEQLWGTYLSAKVLANLFQENQTGMMIHLVEENTSSPYYSMITNALEALIQTIQKEMHNDNIHIKYFEVTNDSIENLMQTHVLK